MPYIKKKLAAKISIGSPRAFNQSVLKLARDGINPLELNAIKGAQRKAEVRMHSRLITQSERNNLRKIVNIKI